MTMGKLKEYKRTLMPTNPRWPIVPEDKAAYRELDRAYFLENSGQHVFATIDNLTDALNSIRDSAMAFDLPDASPASASKALNHVAKTRIAVTAAFTNAIGRLDLADMALSAYFDSINEEMNKEQE